MSRILQYSRWVGRALRAEPPNSVLLLRLDPGEPADLQQRVRGLASLRSPALAVQAGETVVVTDRGHPVARLVPLAGSGGIEVREPLRPFGFQRPAPLVSGGSLEALLEDRERR